MSRMEDSELEEFVERRKGAPTKLAQTMILVASLLSAAGVGGIVVRFQPWQSPQEVLRPDPFTGSMGQELERRIIERTNANSRRIELLENSFTAFAQDSRDRMARVETMFQFLKEQLAAHSKALMDSQNGSKR